MAGARWGNTPGENKARKTPERLQVRRWTIRCRNGKLVTWPMKRFDALAVATWCDDHYPECGPHTLLPRAVSK